MFKNLSTSPDGMIYSWLPKNLNYKQATFFPDACPSKSLIPTGTALITNDENWKEYVLSDIGCGMMLLKSSLSMDDFNVSDWDNLYKLMKSKKGTQADLGSGNHFLDALVNEAGNLYFLIHTGSRLEGKEINKYIEDEQKFIEEYDKVIAWAKGNRMGIKSLVDSIFGQTELILDSVHNSFEILPEGVLIRKGTVRLEEDDLAVIPSNMDGEVAIVRATNKINTVLNSMSHGTGRIMSRSEAKTIAENYDYQSLRKRIIIPEAISNNSIKTEAPFCYRNLDECMNMIKDYVEEIERLIPIAYIGQL